MAGKLGRQPEEEETDRSGRTLSKVVETRSARGNGALGTAGTRSRCRLRLHNSSTGDVGSTMKDGKEGTEAEEEEDDVVAAKEEEDGGAEKEGEDVEAEEEDDAWIQPSEDMEVISSAGETASQQVSEVLILGDLDVGTSGPGKLAAQDEQRWSRVIDVPRRADGGILDELYFETLLESHDLMYTLANDLDLQHPTRVQAAVIPWALEDTDLVICSHTGTGKTLAYLLPVIEQVDDELDDVQAVIIAPARELGMQIAMECERLTKRMDVRSMALIGGANPARQVEKMKKTKPHIVIGTPGRLLDLVSDGRLKMNKVRHIVVDEVDQCLDTGFREDIESLLAKRPRHCQTIFASATADRAAVKDFSIRMMKDPMLIRVEGDRRLPQNIEHHYIVVPQRKRIEMLKKLLFVEPLAPAAICFVESQDRVDIVANVLLDMGFDSFVTLRGDANKVERADALRRFRAGKARLLLSTEVAARGLDLPSVTLVVNLDLPTDADHYIHRAGRCGRAGADGTVVSLAVKQNAFVVSRLEQTMGIKVRHATVYNAALIPPEELPEQERQRRAEDWKEKPTKRGKKLKSNVEGSKGRGRGPSPSLSAETSGRGGGRQGSMATRDDRNGSKTGRSTLKGPRGDGRGGGGRSVGDDRPRTSLDGGGGERERSSADDGGGRRREQGRAASDGGGRRERVRTSSQGGRGGRLRTPSAGGRGDGVPTSQSSDARGSRATGRGRNVESTGGGNRSPKKRTSSKGDKNASPTTVLDFSNVDLDDDDDDGGGGGGGWVIDTPKSKKEKPKRRAKDLRKRASDEGWVGSR